MITLLVLLADVGLGHVDEARGHPERPRVPRAGRLQDLPLRIFRPQHELVLPGRLLQEALRQHGTGCRAYKCGKVRQSWNSIMPICQCCGQTGNSVIPICAIQ